MQKCFQGLFTFDWVLHRRMHWKVRGKVNTGQQWASLITITFFKAVVSQSKYNRVLRDPAQFDVVLYNSESFVDSYS